MKKSFWSMLAIMMVTVLSFSFASCDKDKDKDDDNKNAKGTYTLSYEIEKGTLTDAEYTQLNGVMSSYIQGAQFEDKTLDEVTNEVNIMASSYASGIIEACPGKSFTVKLLIKNASRETVKTIAIEIENGQIKK